MKHYRVLAVIFVSLAPAFAQQNGVPLPKPTPPAAPPPETGAGAVTDKEITNWNAAIVEARTATKEGRFADAEALMLRATQNNPNLILPWVELGLAQMGLKKYSEAEASFKLVLGLDPASVKRAHSGDFYLPDNTAGVVAPGATRASRNTNGGIVNSGQARTLRTFWAHRMRVLVKSISGRARLLKRRPRLTRRRSRTPWMQLSICATKLSSSFRWATPTRN